MFLGDIHLPGVEVPQPVGVTDLTPEYPYQPGSQMPDRSFLLPPACSAGPGGEPQERSEKPGS